MYRYTYVHKHFRINVLYRNICKFLSEFQNFSMNRTVEIYWHMWHYYVFYRYTYVRVYEFFENTEIPYTFVIFVWRDLILQFFFLPFSSVQMSWHTHRHTDTHTDRQTETRDTIAFKYRIYLTNFWTLLRSTYTLSISKYITSNLLP